LAIIKFKFQTYMHACAWHLLGVVEFSQYGQ
jgi:hypothetical protein